MNKLLIVLLSCGYIGVAAVPLARAQTPGQKGDPPPPEALVLKLQEHVLVQQQQIADLQKENAQLRLLVLDEAKKQSAASILQKWNAKPGETINWETLTKTPAPASREPAKDQAGASEKRPDDKKPDEKKPDEKKP